MPVTVLTAPVEFDQTESDMTALWVHLALGRWWYSAILSGALVVAACFFGLQAQVPTDPYVGNLVSTVAKFGALCLLVEAAVLPIYTFAFRPRNCAKRAIRTSTDQRALLGHHTVWLSSEGLHSVWSGGGVSVPWSAVSHVSRRRGAVYFQISPEAAVWRPRATDSLVRLNAEINAAILGHDDAVIVPRRAFSSDADATRFYETGVSSRRVEQVSGR